MSKNYNALWPEQARAKWRIQKRVQTGTLLKPKYCEMCKTPTSANKLQAHHRDYLKPLEVSWYCDSCHKSVHRDLVKYQGRLLELVGFN